MVPSKNMNNHASSASLDDTANIVTLCGNVRKWLIACDCDYQPHYVFNPYSVYITMQKHF